MTEARQWHKAQTFAESCQHAWRGWRYSVSHERNVRIQLGLFGLAVAAGVVLRVSLMELAAVLLASGLVLGLELVNTAVEMLADVVQPAYHDRIGLLKDVTAAAVLWVSVVAIGVGILVYGPRLVSLLGG